MRAGHISLPNGFGLGPGGDGDAVGVAPNELTSSDDRDWFAGTPHHKHVRARLEKVVGVRRTRFDDVACPIARTTDLIGDWWTPLVMREAFYGRRRFDEFQSTLEHPARRADGAAQAAVRRGDVGAGRVPAVARRATSTGSPRRVARSGTCWRRCSAGAATGCGPTVRGRRSCSRTARPAPWCDRAWSTSTPASARRPHASASVATPLRNPPLRNPPHEPERRP